MQGEIGTIYALTININTLKVKYLIKVFLTLPYVYCKICFLKRKKNENGPCKTKFQKDSSKPDYRRIHGKNNVLSLLKMKKNIKSYLLVKTQFPTLDYNFLNKTLKNIHILA